MAKGWDGNPALYHLQIYYICSMKKAEIKKKRPTKYEKPLDLKGKYTFGGLIKLAMSGNPKSKRKK